MLPANHREQKESARLKTFESIIWPHNNTPLTPQRLAAAGFYAAPTSKAADRNPLPACEVGYM
eukprot:767668-Hanusia_phi.AAC.6